MELDCPFPGTRDALRLKLGPLPWDGAVVIEWTRLIPFDVGEATTIISVAYERVHESGPAEVATQTRTGNTCGGAIIICPLSGGLARISCPLIGGLACIICPLIGGLACMGDRDDPRID